MKQKIGILGSGIVAQTLGSGCIGAGSEVMLGTRDPAKLAQWKEQSGGSVGSFAEAAEFGELVILAVKGTVAEGLVQSLAGALAGKTVVDTTNPISDAAPEEGVIQYFTGPGESLMERLQKLAPEAKFVKAFSCVGSALMVKPALPGGPPTMFFCGNDTGAKVDVQELLAAFGWDVQDLGAAPAARAIEPLAMLWCIPGFRENQWTHALKMLRA